MACCVFTAYVMNRLIKACEVLDLDLIKIQYNEFDDGPDQDYGALPKSMAVSKFIINGMTCQACATTIDSAIKALRGVEAVSVSLSLGRASVVHDKESISTSEVLQIIEDKGYSAQPGERNAQQNLEVVQQVKQLDSLRTAFQQAMILASIVITIEWVDRWFSLNSITREVFVFFTGLWVQLMVAWPIHQQAWRGGLFASPSMDTLISLSLLVGLALSIWRTSFLRVTGGTDYFSSGSFLAAVVLGGRYLDALLKRQGSASLARLYELQAETSLVRLRSKPAGTQDKGQTEKPSSNNPERIPALLLKTGNEIFIDSGTIIPCDCYIANGNAMIDQSIMTGESLPTAKGPGDFLMSGTRNLTAELAAIVAKPQEESALEQLVSSISIATEDKSSRGGSDILTSTFVKIILFLALGAATVNYMLNNKDVSNVLKLEKACERAMAVLASACPCALGLASPSAVMSGVSIAWSRGVIVTGGSRTIEKLATLTHMVMDKTGTLTTGRLSVTHVNGYLDARQCMLICAAEREDALVHPVARALFKWALSQLGEQQRSLQNVLEVTRLSNGSTQGVICKVYNRGGSKNVTDHTIHIGNATFLREHGIDESIAKTRPPGNGIAVYVAIDRQHIATVLLQDAIRKETPSVVQTLKSKFGHSVTMLTGDNEVEANRVAQTLDIPVLSSRALPVEKRLFIEQLQSDSQCRGVAMVGDGLNDTSAISAADVGILISPGLSRVNTTSAQVANVILASSSLAALVDVVLIAKATTKQVQFNTWWAITYNIVAVALAAGSLESWGVCIDAAMAGSLMAFSSISVLGWSLWFRSRLMNTRFVAS